MTISRRRPHMTVLSIPKDGIPAFAMESMELEIFHQALRGTEILFFLRETWIGREKKEWGSIFEDFFSRLFIGSRATAVKNCSCANNITYKPALKAVYYLNVAMLTCIT